MRWLDDITDAMYMNLGKLGDSEGQGGLQCFSPWVYKELDKTVRLNNNIFKFTDSSSALQIMLLNTLIEAFVAVIFVLNFVYYLHFIFLCLYFLFFNMFLLSIYRLLQWLSSKESAYNTEYEVSIPGWGRSPGEV